MREGTYWCHTNNGGRGIHLSLCFRGSNGPGRLPSRACSIHALPCLALFRRALSSRCGTGQGDRTAGHPGCGRQLRWTLPRDLNKSLGCVAWLVARWRGCALMKTLAKESYACDGWLSISKNLSLLKTLGA
jgi:hypothetical protein